MKKLFRRTLPQKAMFQSVWARGEHIDTRKHHAREQCTDKGFVVDYLSAGEKLALLLNKGLEKNEISVVFF